MRKAKLDRRQYDKGFALFLELINNTEYVTNYTVRLFHKECSINILYSFKHSHMCEIFNEKDFMLAAIKYGLTLE